MQLSKSKKQVIALYAATFLGAVLNFVASKVNTDVLDTVSYGNVRYVLNIIQLLSWVVLFGWFMSGSRLLALSDDRTRSARIRGALVVFLLIASALLVLLTLTAGLFHHADATVRTLFFCSLPVCFYPLLTNYMNTTAQGDNHIYRLALARVLPVACYIPIALWLYGRYGADSRTVLYLHWGICCAVLVVIIASTRPSFRQLKPVVADLRKENHSYGLQLYWGSLVMVATNYLAGVTLGQMGDDNSGVGFYTLALSLAQPISYLPGIIGTTYFKRFVHENRIPPRVMLVTVAVTLASCLGFILVIKPIVGLYDASYAVVAVYAAWLAVGFSIHGIGDMFNRFLVSHGQGLAIRNSSFACGIFKIAGFIGLVCLMGIKGAIITQVAGSAIYTVCLCFYYLNFLRQENDTISVAQ